MIPIGLLFVVSMALSIRHAYRVGVATGLSIANRTASGLPSRVLVQDIKPAHFARK